ncbi:hypothetical protein B0T14DRAFT_150626 [Immersiella caudata]|uniref:Uncharacterized protein n=1 Tax=Immersiella caudata TaxID=314043 RepID=A0AA40C2I2_9PEZI|nr:hypothetical protein B0T14DRAFT_150626 [Immersiella caudata]
MRRMAHAYASLERNQVLLSQQSKNVTKGAHVTPRVIVANIITHYTEHQPKVIHDPPPPPQSNTEQQSTSKPA